MSSQSLAWSATLLLLTIGLGCKGKTGAAGGEQEPRDLIVGHWSGHATNPAGKDGKAPPPLEFEYEFRPDGTFRMGKRRVWVDGKYYFEGSKIFKVDIKNMHAGPYEIVELSATRLVYERYLDGGRVQRTELTRMP